MYDEVAEATGSASVASEKTPLMGSTTKSQQHTQVEEDSEDEELILSKPTRLSKKPSFPQAICIYFKQNLAILIIVILLIVIFALAGEKASTQGQAASLVESTASALQIQQRPCQIYLDESNVNVNDVEVIQTSLGDPSAHWGQLPCLVRNEGHEHKLGHGHEKDDSPQWNWLFNQFTTENNDGSTEPIEYGMPSADIIVDFDAISHPDREPIMGFGGAFTEASALNYMSLNQEGREAVISLLFGKDGLGYR